MLKIKKQNFFLLIFLILIILFFLLKINTIQIIDCQSQKIIFEKRITNNEQFKIKYLHSVAKTPVIEFFEIKDEKILLTKTEYQSYGAGLPTSAVKGQYILKNNKFIIKNINQKLPEILLRVSNYARHEFIIDNKKYNLYQLIENENLIQIKTKNFSYLRFILKEVLQWLKKNT